MRITIELRRPARRSIALVLGALLLLTPAAVLAGHQFSDVDDLHPFHADVDWMADYGIANGFDDGTYRPSEPVTRQAMAAFMHRLSSEFDVLFNQVDPRPGTTFTHATVCPDDKRPIAGGGVIAPAMPMTGSSPSDRNSWRVTWISHNGVTVDPPYLEVWVTCAPRL